MLSKSLSRTFFASRLDGCLTDSCASPRQLQVHAKRCEILGIGGMNVLPNILPLPELPLRRGVIVGYPTGAHRGPVKALEAFLAVAAGADEIDLVINRAAVAHRQYKDIFAEIEQVRCELEASTRLSAVIDCAEVYERRGVENGDADIAAISTACVEAGASAITVASGWTFCGSPLARATAVVAEAIGLVCSAGHDLGLTVRGEIKHADAAMAMFDAGATRLAVTDPAELLDQVYLGGTRQGFLDKTCP